LNSYKDQLLTYICLRNHGDCLIQANFIAQSMKGQLKSVLVVTSKKNKFIFDEKGIECITIPGTSNGVIQWIKFIYLIFTLRANVFCFFGDIRERLLTLFFLKSNIYIPIWPKSHYFNQVLRMYGPLFHSKNRIYDNLNIYSDFEAIVQYSDSTRSMKNRSEFQHFNIAKNLSKPRDLNKIISIQVMGSIREKIIPDNLVILLVEKLLQDGYGINFIGDELQIGIIKNNFSFYNRQNIFYFDNFDEGRLAITSSLGFIGVDSFWAHFAIFESIPALIFTGGFPPGAIYPKDVQTFSVTSICSAFPCNSHSICFGSNNLPLSCFGNGNSKLVLEEVDKFIISLEK
jgi:hypothetical protein